MNVIGLLICSWSFNTFFGIKILIELVSWYSRDPIPVPEIQRRPLTEVQVFNLQVNHRAAERAEFDKKVLDLRDINCFYCEHNKTNGFKILTKRCFLRRSRTKKRHIRDTEKKQNLQGWWAHLFFNLYNLFHHSFYFINSILSDGGGEGLETDSKDVSSACKIRA